MSDILAAVRTLVAAHTQGRFLGIFHHCGSRGLARDGEALRIIAKARDQRLAVLQRQKIQGRLRAPHRWQGQV